MSSPGVVADADWRPKRDQNLVSRQIAGETLLVPIRSGAADLDFLFVLNDTAAWIWERVDGVRSVDQLVQELVITFQVDAARARQDVEQLLSNLREAGLVHRQPA